MLKMILKNGKKEVIFTRDHMDATWHSEPRDRAMQTYASAHVARCDVHIYIYRNYKGYITYKHSVVGI